MSSLVRFFRRNPLPLILALAMLVRLVGLAFPFGDYDEGVYLATVRSVLHGHPLISQTYNSQGPLFIYLSELFYRVSPTLEAVRLFPVACSLAVIVLAYRLVDREVGRFAAVAVSLYLCLDTFFLLVSRTFQVDVPWLASASPPFSSCYATVARRRRATWPDRRSSWRPAYC
jgi:4-amino-4-deoxy-L-arabinose transferase-like glycosyltransferase